VEFGIVEEEVRVVAIVEVGEHVTEGGLGGFACGGSEEEAGEILQRPSLIDGEFVEVGVWEVV